MCFTYSIRVTTCRFLRVVTHSRALLSYNQFCQVKHKLSSCGDQWGSILLQTLCFVSVKSRSNRRQMCEHPVGCMSTMWDPPVVSWFINPIIYSYKCNKPYLSELSAPFGPHFVSIPVPVPASCCCPTAGGSCSFL